MYFFLKHKNFKFKRTRSIKTELARGTAIENLAKIELARARLDKLDIEKLENQKSKKS